MSRKSSVRSLSREPRVKILITGGNGFVAQQLAKALLQPTQELRFDELILVDIERPVSPVEDDRLRCLKFDLTEAEAFEELFNTNIDIIFHLAAVVSGEAERNFDLGLRVNVDATRNLLETIRHQERHNTRLIFSSSVGVFGSLGSISESTAVLPQSSYGYQKAISELLINDYTRKGYIDGRVLRFPTITVRSGSANTAVTSFASGIIREPLSGKIAVCPVAKDLQLWISSPDTLVKNLIHASTLPAEAFGPHRNVNLPGIAVSVQQMIESLSEIAGEETTQLIRFEFDEEINRIVSSLPFDFDLERAMSLGFVRDNHISHIIQSYIDSELKGETDSSDDSEDSESSDE